MYQPDKMGLQEARLYAIQSIVQSHVDDLTTALARYDWTSELRPVQSDAVFIGESWVEQELNPAKGVGTGLQFFISGGGPRTGLDITSEWSFIGCGAKHYELDTIINAIIHPEVMRHRASARLQAERREIVLVLIADWLRAVFNDQGKYGHALIHLQSEEYQPAPTYDRIVGQIVSITKGVLMRGGGSSQGEWGVTAHHHAVIE